MSGRKRRAVTEALRPGDRLGFPFRRGRRQNMRSELERRLQKGEEVITRLAPHGMSLEVLPGMRWIHVNEWSAFERRAHGRLSELLRRWEAHDEISCIAIDGKLGSFAAKDSVSIDEMYELYALVRKLKRPLVGMVDGLVTLGGWGLVGTRAVVSCEATMPPLLASDVLDELPRFIDGGVGFALSRSRYGRCAALSGLPVSGNSFKLAGLATHVLSNVGLDLFRHELADLAQNADDDYFVHNIDSLLEMRAFASMPWVDADKRANQFKELADLCFEPADLDAIKSLLDAAQHPLADHASHAIHEFPAHAALLASFLDKCAKLPNYRSCLDLEKIVAKNLTARPITQDAEVETYFVDSSSSIEQGKLGF